MSVGGDMDIPVTNGGEKSGVPLSRKGRLERLLNSPILLVVLVLATAALAVKWYGLEASLKAPALPGWSWSQHPNSLLVYYPHTDCGCGPGLSPVLKQATTHHLDVAIVSDVQAQELKTLSKEAAGIHAYLLTSASPTTMHKWCPSGNTALYRVDNGRTAKRAQGTNVPDAFFR